MIFHIKWDPLVSTRGAGQNTFQRRAEKLWKEKWGKMKDSIWEFSYVCFVIKKTILGIFILLNNISERFSPPNSPPAYATGLNLWLMLRIWPTILHITRLQVKLRDSAERFTMKKVMGLPTDVAHIKIMYKEDSQGLHRSSRDKWGIDPKKICLWGFYSKLFRISSVVSPPPPIS